MAAPKYLATREQALVTNEYPTAFAHRCKGQRIVHIFVGLNGQQRILGRAYNVHDAWKSAASNIGLI
ncbi:MAG: hypothetical protein UU11_C0003G0084 [Parcubacteria group bacterium GW2011_GWF2_40_69]|nr:MAG: hypothetical protein UT25_C0001G0238 [Parcubacteria group bacterium GW2011_GWC1_39_12]KKR19762.1 MAG: hypothetical protein UT49_C0001G0238 [Parcubacteria group bacterium GW2011_GWF1_39_37]KKR52730.1 MAG: hypothetical protein UT89_C0001G0238 [Parcubacteria group bacterium GW2011_GWE1_40_20]KKR64930.1 MAG: hypothetical protein UU06_C0034G0004 [Parcubacteria group bacterium GW2011_GWB1_40_5]KKR69090.1 MAG: hypothetical protein UU11_C0003G0084 [Parcubacteria group bacterium GW2011_GWF2_40_6